MTARPRRRAPGAIAAAALGCAGAWAGAAAPDDARQTVALTVVNRSGGAIVCQAAIAHWFTTDFGPAPAGGRMTVAFRRDRASGTLYLLSLAGEAMAVESLWCGRADRPWSTRSTLDLPRGADDTGAHRVTCTAGAEGRLACE